MSNAVQPGQRSVVGHVVEAAPCRRKDFGDEVIGLGEWQATACERVQRPERCVEQLLVPLLALAHRGQGAVSRTVYGRECCCTESASQPVVEYTTYRTVYRPGSAYSFETRKR